MIKTIKMMNTIRTPLAACCLAGSAFLGLVLCAPDCNAAAAIVVVDDDVDLHHHMEAINDHLRGIMRGLADETKRAEVLEHVAGLQKHLVGAKMHGPPALDKQPEADRDAYANGYRKAMAEVLVEAAKLEIDILDGRIDEATNRIRETMINQRNAAHAKYQVDD